MWSDCEGAGREFGNRQYDFRVRLRFPKRLSDEFLFVDALNNLAELAEDEQAVLARARQRRREMDGTKLRRALGQFGLVATRKRVMGWWDA